MVQNYNRFVNEQQSHNDPKIVVLSKLLMFEAQIACRAGTIEGIGRSARHDQPTKTGADERNRDSYHHRETVSTTRGKLRTNSVHGRSSQEGRCRYCGNYCHVVTECGSRFIELSVRKRWPWAKDNGACFRCLVEKHNRNRCRASTCQNSGCGLSYHTLLHTEKRPLTSTPAEPKNVSTSAMSKNHMTTNSWQLIERRVSVC